MEFVRMTVCTYPINSKLTSMLQIKILVLQGQQETVFMEILQTSQLQVIVMHRRGFIIALIKDNQFIRGSKRLRADQF